MEHRIDLPSHDELDIYPLGGHFYGASPDGDVIDFTNYYMRAGGEPFFGISGEIHFSRCDESSWSDELGKMKACGINIVSTYVFWNHHEEIEGEFVFSGRKDLRRFLTLCQKHGLYVILRVGPFDHGEVRNGGFPDWLYGKPFTARTLDDGFLFYVNRLYEKIGHETRGLYYKDGGPIIGVQMDNEYGHSSAMWENTTGISNEWVEKGHEGEAYLYRLRELAVNAGIEAPFYTCTAWGGAATPDEMLPLWGGYAYRPWLFYENAGEHPATEEYHYSDFHRNNVKTNNEFEPLYDPETRPYACCEMGGGMTCSYNYRFSLDYRSVDAMTNIKLGSGCNFLGYYVFKGGTNPKGRFGGFMNEAQVPKLSYDYQAAIGEFGQIRESYMRLKAFHYFLSAFGSGFCGTRTYLPKGAMEVSPDDTETLRFAVRKNGKSGYIFFDNFQDHVLMPERKDESVLLHFDDEELSLEGISLSSGENCMLPFHMDLGGIDLIYATIQPVTMFDLNNERSYLFMCPDGMTEKLVFDEKVTIEKGAHHYGNLYRISSSDGGGKIVNIFTVSRKVMDHIYVMEHKNRRIILYADGALLADDGGIRIETESPAIRISVLANEDIFGSDHCDEGMWKHYDAECPPHELKALPERINDTRYSLDLSEAVSVLDDIKDILLEIEYNGDIGMAFIDGEMVHDNFCNGKAWEIGLKPIAKDLRSKPLTLYISPLRIGARVNVDSPMAARSEETDETISELFSVKLTPVYEHSFKFR